MGIGHFGIVFVVDHFGVKIKLSCHRKSSHLGMSFQSDQEAFLGWKFGSPVV
jgi:hypothetical protein